MPGHSRVERGLEWSTEASDCGLGEPLPKTFVLAFTGGGDGHEFMSENVEDIAGYLHSALGYAPPSSTVGSEHYVLDASKSKIPLKDLSDQLAHLEATMRCCDRLLVYYSGHGMRLVQSVRAGNMLPMWCYVRNTDKSGKTDVSEVTRTCFKDDGVPVSVAEGDQVLATGSGGAKWAMLVGGLALDASTLADRLAKLKSCHITVISDACYSGGFKHRLLEVKGVRTVIAATGEYETREYDPGYSIFGYRTGHGTTFSQALLAGLKSTDVSQSGLDLLWRDGFNDPATLDNDSFAKRGRQPRDRGQRTTVRLPHALQQGSVLLLRAGVQSRGDVGLRRSLRRLLR